MTLKSFITPAIACFCLVLFTTVTASYIQPSETPIMAELEVTGLPESTATPDGTLSPTLTGTPVLTTTIPAITGTIAPTPKPTTKVTPKATVKVTPKPTVSTACIITVSGKRYDVTRLRSTHSGGNIFKCGTDMTNTYQQMHGTSVKLISRYLIP